ncbi:MAG: hypothetical protein ACLQIB_40460 [Isosphaeraceae bacterium]
MLLTVPEVVLFFKLLRSLMFYVNQRLHVVSHDLANPEDFASLAPEVGLTVRKAFLENTGLLQSFVEENPAHLPKDELAIVSSWRHLVAGKFYILRELKKHTVFLSSHKQPIAYGVLALSEPFQEVIGPILPCFAETVLLPFKGSIIYDGLTTAYGISFGPGIRRTLNEEFKQPKARHGIVTSLPMSADPMPLAATKPKAKPP